MRTLSSSQARLGMALAALLGLFASSYLLYTYVTGGPIACGIVHGCEVVRASKWAKTIFGLPRPLLGVIFYVAVYKLLVVRAVTQWRKRELYLLTLLFALVGFIESGVLFVIQWLDLKAFCMWCLTSAVAATLIAGCAIFDRQGPSLEQGQKELRRLFYLLLAFLPVALIGFLVLTHATAPAASILPLPTNTETTATSTPTVRDILLTPETPITGAASSSVLVVEYLDFECPACRAFYPTMKKIQQEYSARVTFAVREFPLWEIHSHAKAAAVAAECARRQGKFFPFANALYETETDFSTDAFVRLGLNVGLNESRLRLCMADTSVTTYIEQERAAAVKLGLQYTPTIFVNRIKIDQALPYDELKKVIDQELAKNK